VDEIAGGPGVLALRSASFGAAGACFTVYREQTEETPRRYTVGAGQSVDDEWNLDAPGPHVISVAGPNGSLRDAAYGGVARTVTLAAGERGRVEWSVAASEHWYDVLIDGPGDDTTRLAGHVETGKPSISDPAATAPVLTL
jgi:phospholipase C